MKTEDGFFPKLAGELGSSLSDIKQHQKRLEDFKPNIVVSFPLSRICYWFIFSDRTAYLVQ